jgi:S-adenosylmethionine hydrolase
LALSSDRVVSSAHCLPKFGKGLARWYNGTAHISSLNDAQVDRQSGRHGRNAIPRMGIIALITDFGLSDGYVGAMKGVMLSIVPHVAIVDISHAVAAQDTRSAAWILYTAYHTFPPGTVFCTVVDPGVGSQRRALAVQAGAFTFVAPDNGLLSYVLSHEPLRVAVELTNPRFHHHPVSHTFHGRDVFAPAAAYSAQGVPLDEMGPTVDRPIVWPLQRPELDPEGALIGHVIHVDRFGNCITDLCMRSERTALVLSNPPGDDHKPLAVPRIDVRIRVGGCVLQGIGRTYADGPSGQPLVLVGSSGHLEIAVVDGSAAQTLGLGVGDRITLYTSV